MHRVLSDVTQKGLVDHIDGDPLNNCRSNLRVTTYGVNNYNAKLRSSNVSGIRGVSWDKERNKWRAQIGEKGINTFLGRFDTLEEARRVYTEAALKAYGFIPFED